ncbi:MAG: helix-turn-helix transcriptional regulator [Peptostreptococcus sp.]|uniref:helix-turn-helix domain-containing protein n=1 Tax=Peptostreptococcus sp. TaxID=1262 RepID=UPI002FCA36A1
MSDTKKNISSNLKRLMNENNINNSELSKKLGVSESTVGKWLLEKSVPRMGVIEQIASLFNVQKSDILEQYKSNNTTEDIITKDKYLLLSKYNSLNVIGKKEALKRVSELTEIDKYTTELTLAAHNDDTSEDQIDLMIKDFEEMDKW